jgi:hypothetical protein
VNRKPSTAPTAQVARRPLLPPQLDRSVREGVESPAQALDPGLRLSLQARLGHDFGDIRIHSGPQADAAAMALGARAYISGHDIVFAAGRYQPGTAEGRELIAHELVHAAQAASADIVQPGIAPEASCTEQAADRIAAAAVAQGARPGPPRPAGPVWAVHRKVERVRKVGKVEHSGAVGTPAGGKGQPLGQVEVRSGEDVDITGGRLPNTIAIAYTGSLSADSRWLQFVWFEMVGNDATGTAHYNGTLSIQGQGTKALSTKPESPVWSIDAVTGPNPFYEGGYANLRKANSTTIFDAPGGGIVQPLADAIYQATPSTTALTFTAHFETFLIQKDQAVYVVPWQASTAFTHAGKTTTTAATGYTIGAAGAIQGLPAGRKTLLDQAYPRSRQIR